MTGCAASSSTRTTRRAVVARLRAAGYDAQVERERLAGEDDDEDHPWAVLTDAPELELELLVEQYDGWLDAPRSRRGRARRDPRRSSCRPQPRKIKRPS